MAKLSNGQIIERSRQELAKASKGPITLCTERSGSLPYCCSFVCANCTSLVDDKGQPFWVRGLDECKNNIMFLKHAHENLAACHAEIDRLTKMVNAMRECDNCKHGMVDRDELSCDLDKYWEGCGYKRTYEFWEWEGA